MRGFHAKILTGSIMVGSALLVAACGHRNSSAADANLANLDTMDSSAGMSNDMSAIDATANDAAMAAGNEAIAPPAANLTEANRM